MCNSLTVATKPARLLLASVESYADDGPYGRPKPLELCTTGVAIMTMLIVSEQSFRLLLSHYQHFHPLLQDSTNRNILARHVGVDALSCFVVAILGWNASYINQDMIDALWRGKKRALSIAFENRIFKYYPEALRLILFFFVYQIKNTYDTIIWKDGPEFIAHHILTLFTAWGALHPGTSQYYAMFYFGVSEVSTGVLCLLANFDDVHGVSGLAEAFPTAKLILGGTFAILFVICRVVMWSNVSYYYCRDAWNALSSTDPRLEGRRLWLRYTFVSLSLLSLLQIIWLAEIARIGREELKVMGML